jgi:formylglycine-generating enzyme required for sulfatase activity
MVPRLRAVSLSLLVVAVLVPGLLSQPGHPGKLYALVVGIDEYQHGDLGKLKHAENDAKVLASELQGLGYEVTLLTGDKATKATIEKQLRTVASGAKKDDLVLVALSGHGMQFEGRDEAFFCPSDARPSKERAETLVSMKTVFAELTDSFAGSRVLLVDACRNDPGVRGRSGIEAVSAPAPRGVATLYGCAPGQRAHEDDKLEHGVFMYCVLEGLRGADKAKNSEGEVTFASLSEYVQGQVKSRVSGLPGSPRQTPEVDARFNSQPILVPKGASAAARSFANTIGLELVRIDAGEFLMGSPPEEKGRAANEGPQRKVRITKPFYLGKYPVTRGQFRVFVESNKGYKTEAETDGKGTGFEKMFPKIGPEFTWRNPGFAQTDEHPVVLVTWNDAQAFLNWLSEKEKRRYTLPTEAEWEYACRAGSKTAFFFGDDPQRLGEYAWFVDNSRIRGTTLVGQGKANAWGLRDMYGNAAQWCQDRFGNDYYRLGENVDPQGPREGGHRVVRGGGGFYSNQEHCRSAYRQGYFPNAAEFNVGFRVCYRPE